MMGHIFIIFSLTIWYDLQESTIRLQIDYYSFGQRLEYLLLRIRFYACFRNIAEHTVRCNKAIWYLCLLFRPLFRLVRLVLVSHCVQGSQEFQEIFQHSCLALAFLLCWLQQPAKESRVSSYQISNRRINILLFLKKISSYTLRSKC